MIIVLSLLMRWCQGRLGIQWGKSQEEESFHQVGAVGTILADAQHDAVAIQLLFSEFEKRQERLLAGFMCECLGQGHVQDVVVVIQNLVIERFVQLVKCYGSLARNTYTHRVPA